MEERSRAVVLSLVLLFLGCSAWELTGLASHHAGHDDTSGLVARADQVARLPRPSEVAAFAFEQLREPFYDRGTNDKGIDIQVVFSLGRVLAGYCLALLVSIPLGFVIGMSPLFMKALDPFIQVLRPISPL